MIPTKLHRLLLLVSGLVAVTIGATLLVAPAAFHASNGITLGGDPSLLSEVRAPGGLLLVLGLMILTGAVRRAMTLPATWISALLYLAYGGARLVSLALDGPPATGLLVATAIELGLGVASALFVLRTAGREGSAHGRAVATREAA